MKWLNLFLVVVIVWSCDHKEITLYGDIRTDIVAITAHSHDEPGYQPMPDSLRLQFNKILRTLRVNVVAAGCQPDPIAEVEEKGDSLWIGFDMQNACRHVRTEFFDVDMFVSPVHADVFHLIVEERDFGQDETGHIVLSRPVDVRQLPGID